MAQQRKKKRRQPAAKKKRGIMIGMRSGFKKAARGVGVGVDGEKAASEKKKKSSWLSTAFTILLVLAAIAVLYYRSR